MIEILERGECFTDDGDFQHSKLIYRRDDELSVGYSKFRGITLDQDIPSDLTDISQISPECYCPEFPSTFQQADTKTVRASFIKRPGLMGFVPEDPRAIARRLLQEAQTCEKLKREPHKNIARYLGCQVENGLIVGLCFRPYVQTLESLVNPTHNNKYKFRIPPKYVASVPRWISDLRDGAEHMHRLKLVHNDIRPGNVMLDHHGTLVIIDFDSTLPEGKGLQNVERAYGWHDEKVETAQPEDDMLAIQEIKFWLQNQHEKYQYQSY